jgi:hypothetical protein
VAMKNSTETFTISHTKCKKENFKRDFEDYFVWNAAEAF